MPVDINYTQIGEDLRTLLQTNVPGFRAVLHEPNGVDMMPHNCPLCIVTLGPDGQSEVRVGQSYYDTFTFNVEIYAIDLSSWADAAKLRNELFRQARHVVRSNSRWSADLDASRLRAYEFGQVQTVEEEAWFAAVARFEVVCFAYYDR